MRKIFQMIVIVSTIIYVVFWFWPTMGLEQLSEIEFRLVQYQGYEAIMPVIPILSWSQFVLWLSASVGLLFFIKAARTLFLILCLIEFVILPLSGYVVFTAFESLMVHILSMADGAILAMAYLTSISGGFSNSPLTNRLS